MSESRSWETIRIEQRGQMPAYYVEVPDALRGHIEDGIIPAS